VRCDPLLVSENRGRRAGSINSCARDIQETAGTQPDGLAGRPVNALHAGCTAMSRRVGPRDSVIERGPMGYLSDHPR